MRHVRVPPTGEEGVATDTCFGMDWGRACWSLGGRHLTCALPSGRRGPSGDEMSFSSRPASCGEGAVRGQCGGLSWDDRQNSAFRSGTHVRSTVLSS